MQSMKVFRLLMVSFLVIGTQSAVFASDATGVAGNGLEQKGELAKVVVATEDIIAGAQVAINEARGSLFRNNTMKVEDKKYVGIIIAQNAIMVQAKQQLKKMADTFIKKVETELTEEGFLSKLIIGVKNFATKTITPFRVGYGKTEEEKENAPEIIKGLEEQQARITQIYGTLLKTDLTSSEQVQLKGRYEAVIAQLNDAIYEQQLITGDVMSTQRKILLGAAAAGTAAGLVLARQYFSTSDAAETTVDRAGMPEGAVVSVEVSQVSSEEINQQPIVEVIVEPTVETTVESTAVPTVPAVELTVESPVEPTELTVETTVESVEPTLPSTELKPSTEPMRLTPAEYFELHNPTIEAARRVAGAVGEAVRTGIKALPEAVNRVPVSEQEEYFVEKYGSEATQIISSKIEPGLETIKGKIKLSKE